MSVDLAHLILRILTIWNLFLIAALICSSGEAKYYSGKIAVFFLVTVISLNIAFILPPDQLYLAHLFGCLASTTPFSLWAMLKSLSNEDFRLKKAHFFLVLLPITAAYSAFYFGQGKTVMTLFQEQNWIGLGFEFLAIVVFSGFVLLSLLAAFNRIDDDMVDKRVKLRRTLGAAICITGAGVIVFRLSIGIEGAKNPDYMLILLAIVFIVSGIVIPYVHINLKGLFGADRKPRTVVNQSDYSPECLKLLEFMTQEKPYFNANLKLSILSDNLRVPEYLLRKAINQELDHRNFNSFLNSYRVQEAAALLHSDRSHEKIFSIALEVGFNSLAPFNRAFKDQYGMTPSEYREAKDLNRAASL